MGNLLGALIPMQNRRRTVISMRAREWAHVSCEALCASLGAWRLCVCSNATLYPDAGGQGDRVLLYCHVPGPNGQYFVCADEFAALQVPEALTDPDFHFPVYVAPRAAVLEQCQPQRLAAGR